MLSRCVHHAIVQDDSPLTGCRLADVEHLRRLLERPLTQLGAPDLSGVEVEAAETQARHSGAAITLGGNDQQARCRLVEAQATWKNEVDVLIGAPDELPKPRVEQDRNTLPDRDNAPRVLTADQLVEVGKPLRLYHPIPLTQDGQLCGPGPGVLLQQNEALVVGRHRHIRVSLTFPRIPPHVMPVGTIHNDGAVVLPWPLVDRDHPAIPLGPPFHHPQVGFANLPQERSAQRVETQLVGSNDAVKSLCQRDDPSIRDDPYLTRRNLARSDLSAGLIDDPDVGALRTWTGKPDELPHRSADHVPVTKRFHRGASSLFEMEHPSFLVDMCSQVTPRFG